MEQTNLFEALSKPKFTLNEGQQIAYDGLRDAILRRAYTEHRQFLLNGYAGTGKTFVMNRIVEAVRDIAPGINFGMTAPTHKAVKVLKKHSELADLLDFGTIHSFLGLKQVLTEQRDGSMKVEYKPDYKSNRGRRIDGIHVLIIDESSMLDDDLFEHLQVELRSTHGLLIIYMGDEKQIPPVGKKQKTGESHAIPFLLSRQKAHNIKVFSLTEPQRQAKESPIIMYSVAIREQSDRQRIDFPITEDMKEHLEQIPGKAESLPILREIFSKYFDTPEFEADQDYVKVIAYMNKTVNYFNKEIRLLLNKTDALPKIINNEKLILDKPLIDKDDKIILHTNEEVKTEDVELSSMEIKYRLYPTNLMEEERLLQATGESTIKKILKVETYKVTLVTEDRARHRVSIIHENSEKEFDEMRETLRTSALRTTNTYHKKDLWSQYFKIENNLAWVKYNYAITAHKSQGSTYDYAVSMEMDIEKDTDIEERNRIRYVAATRARHKLFVVK